MSPAGLSEAEVEVARARWGPNLLPEARRSVWALVGRQFQDVMVYILLAALAISLATPFLEDGPITPSRFLEAAVIATILVLNAVLGVAQEYQAERAIAALARLSAPRARVRRAGVVREIAAGDLVPGDVILIEAGDRLSADAGLLESAHLQVDESTLTGESLPVDKSSPNEALYSGTLATRGSGEAVVRATGVHTELGQIASLVGGIAVRTTPLQVSLQRLGRNLGVVALVLSLLVTGVGLARGLPWLEILLVGISLAVSAVPEGLPAVVTVCFAIGVRRMAAHHALVRRLDALETLGAVTVICVDKTGTLTENRMSVVAHRAEPDVSASELATVLASCSHGDLPESGDPTELALLAWADRLGAPRLPIDVEEVPFTSEAPYMRTRHGEQTFLKGSPAWLLEHCDDAPPWVADEVTALARRGLRVLAAARLQVGRVRVIGVVGMADPPRDGVTEAVAEASRAGIRTVMITGDNPVTAEAIGAQVGIEGRVRTGAEIDGWSPADLQEDVAGTAIYARVSPQHKVALCEALIARGEVVAMTGDGVNDAPALKRAHVGVAMGLRGTDVAREAAAVVLADDHFATLVRAVREGRRIHDNIRKFVLFLLRSNFDELLLILTVVAAGLPLPLLPVHILWVNLVTDGLPALALAAEPGAPDLMERPPRDPRAHLLAGSWGRLIGSTLVSYSAILTFFLWRLSSGEPIEETRASTLTLVIGIELVQAMSSRSERPLWRVDLTANRWLLGALAVAAGAHLVLIVTPIGGFVGLGMPTGADWVRIAVFVAVCGLVLELLKLLLPSRSASPTQRAEWS